MASKCAWATWHRKSKPRLLRPPRIDQSHARMMLRMSMPQIKETNSSAENTSSLDFEQARRSFQQEGYVVFPNLVSKAFLTRHTQDLCDAFDRANAAGPLFSGGGGMVMGHLNCFPGQQTRAIYDRLTETGVIDFIRSLWPRATGLPNVGCNFNLPRSSAQNYHMD